MDSALSRMASEHAVKVLPRYVRSEFAQLAYNLPPSADFWSVMEEEIDVRAACLGAIHGDRKAVIQFLSIFFTSQIVEDVEAKLAYLSNSFLGLEYTFRKGYAELAKSVLADVHEKPPLNDFFGWVSPQSEAVFLEPRLLISAPLPSGQSPPLFSRMGGDQDEGESSNRGRRGDGDNEDQRDRLAEHDDAQGGGDGGDESDTTNDQFPELKGHVVVILMSLFSTPTKDDYSKSSTLKARSKEFIDACGELLITKKIYEPRYSTRGYVMLYHGTRTSSLPKFERIGIFPPPRSNEFNVGCSFYVTNSLRQAYEHPLHKHLSQDVDPISVLVFELDVSIMHGEKIAPAETCAFKCKWFPCHTPREEKLWSQFCSKNLDWEGDLHDYDLVIGPICIRKGENINRLYGEIPGHIPLIQVAFCTPRARLWLKKCLKSVYKEERSKDKR